jgi:hypothetical protein
MCGVVRDTLTAEFGEELAYLAALDAARAEMRAVVEMPEKPPGPVHSACVSRAGAAFPRESGRSYRN